MKYPNSNSLALRKNSLAMGLVIALGSVSVIACTPDNTDSEVNERIDKSEFIDRVDQQGVFEEWDVNDDNQLSENEWSNHDQYNLIYESWDNDGNGQLSKNEFHEGLYKHYDNNNSDAIEQNEWDKAKNAGWMVRATN